jgi:hypothetical protein
MLKRERIHDPEHERFVRTLPCVCCGDITSTECAHVSYTDLRYGKLGRGKGQKEESCWVLPLCGQHHRRQHDQGETAFWKDQGIDPSRVALALWLRSGDINMATVIIENARL